MDAEALNPRTPKADELSKVLDFLNKNLRSDVGWAIGTEYPTALTEQNRHNMSIIMDEENHILSHAVLKTLIYKTPYAPFRIGAIGSVVTDPEFRNQGLSKKNIQKCLDLATEQDCDLTILWTNQYELYRKFGFELAGFEYTYEITTAPIIQNKDYKFIKGNKVDPNAILRLYNNHSINGVRTAEDIRKFLQIPNSNIFTLWNKQNQLVAYAVEGKGSDLTNYIHEWGGNTNDISDLLGFMIESEKKAFTFMCPMHSVNLRKTLDGLSSLSHQGFLGMIKIHNLENVLNKIKKAFRAEGLEKIVLEKRDGQILFGYDTDLYTINNESDLVKILFGPTLMSDLSFMKTETQAQLQKLLPLPLWVWGWDSI